MDGERCSVQRSPDTKFDEVFWTPYYIGVGIDMQKKLKAEVEQAKHGSFVGGGSGEFGGHGETGSFR